TTSLPLDHVAAVIVEARPAPVTAPYPYTTLFRSWLVKSPAPSPDTDSLNVTLKTSVAALVMLSLFEVPESDPDCNTIVTDGAVRSVVTTSALESRDKFVCRLLLETTNKRTITVPS